MNGSQDFGDGIPVKNTEHSKQSSQDQQKTPSSSFSNFNEALNTRIGSSISTGNLEFYIC